MPRESLQERVQKTPGYNARSLRKYIAQQLIEDSMQTVAGEDTEPLMSALGRVLVHYIISPIYLPPHDNSSMDGYAFRGQDLLPHAPMSLRNVGTILAGQADLPSVGPGQCVRIMTGGVMPAGCDTLVPQELVHLVEVETITLLAGTVSVGDNRRLRGEDLQRDKPALRAGRRLRPSDLGLLASLGIAEVVVRRRVKVAFFLLAMNCGRSASVSTLAQYRFGRVAHYSIGADKDINQPNKKPPKGGSLSSANSCYHATPLALNHASARLKPSWASSLR